MCVQGVIQNVQCGAAHHANTDPVSLNLCGIGAAAAEASPPASSTSSAVGVQGPPVRHAYTSAPPTAARP